MDLEEYYDTDEEYEEEFVVISLAAVACTMLVDYYEKHMTRIPCRTSSYKGHQHVFDILNGHPVRCHELFRMETHVFLRLVRELKNRNLLQDSRGVTVEEQLAIFLLTIGHNERNRKLQEDFQHSGETISRHFNSVLRAMSIFSMSMIVPPSFNQTPSYIHNNPRFWPHFKGCIGAIDGTHIDAIVPLDKQLAYRGRKGKCTQNVMAACSFDMKFTFVWAGWEGSAHDSRILREALNHPTLNFPNPPNGKYYLVDAGYPNMRGFLSPFKKVRYHNSAYQNNVQANGKEELFNRRHSSLRNVIERCFGVWKARWPILRCMAPYPFETQRLIVVASMTVHNFIRQEAQFDSEFRRQNELGENHIEDEGHESDDDSSSDDEENEMDMIRLAIANSIQAS